MFARLDLCLSCWCEEWLLSLMLMLEIKKEIAAVVIIVTTRGRRINWAREYLPRSLAGMYGRRQRVLDSDEEGRRRRRLRVREERHRAREYLCRC
jgi:hypothetical protein